MKTIKLRHYIGNALIVVALVLSFVVKDAGWGYTFRLAAVCLSFALVFEPDREDYLEVVAKEYFAMEGCGHANLPKYFETKNIYSIASAPTLIAGICCGFLLQPSLLVGITDIVSSVIGAGLFLLLTEVRKRTGLSKRMLTMAKEEAKELLANNRI